jgi:hypothetical protein
MRSNLAEINTIVNDRISSGNDNLQFDETDICIGGFRVPDAKKREAVMAQRKRQIDNYNETRSALEQKLAGLDVKPLAILPTKIWKRICEESGLYRFTPNAFSMVPVNTSFLKRFQFAALILSITLWGGIAAGEITRIILFTKHASTINNVATFILLAATVVTVVVFTNIEPNGFIKVDGWITCQLTRILDWWPHKWVMKMFFPDRENVATSTVLAPIEFPTPPAKVVAILQRIASLRPSVAVVAEGFQFTAPPSKILRKQVENHTQRRIRAWAERPDPIIYVEHGHVTAIVAQFGDFPIEREIVQRVANNVANNPEYLI